MWYQRLQDRFLEVKHEHCKHYRKLFSQKKLVLLFFRTTSKLTSMHADVLFKSTAISMPSRQSIPASREISFEKTFPLIFKPLISTTKFAVHQVQMILEVKNKLASMRADIMRNTAPSMPSSRQYDRTTLRTPYRRINISVRLSSISISL